MRIRPALLACTILSLASPFALPASADVLVVGGGGPGAFAQIQTAVTAASDGDVLLVKSGTYSAFTIEDKSLTVVADVDAVVTIDGTTTVQNLAAGRTVVLSGLQGRGITQANANPSAGVGLLLRANAGFVRVQDSSFEGARGAGENVYVPPGSSCCDLPGQQTGGWAGVRIENCPGGTMLRDALLTGGRGRNAWYECYQCGSNESGGDGLHVIGSVAAIYESLCTGGRGEQNGHQGGVGGAGARFVAGAQPTGGFLSGTSFQGGMGGNGTDFIPTPGGDGGPGLAVGVGTHVQILQSTSAGGAAGISLFGAGMYDGNPGPATLMQGTSFTFPVTRVLLDAPRIVRADQVLPIQVRGTPGEIVSLYFGRATKFQVLPSWRGTLLVAGGSPARSILLGEIPPSGVLATSLELPPLGPAVGGSTRFLQVWKREPLGGNTLGEPACVTIVDPAF